MSLGSALCGLNRLNNFGAGIGLSVDPFLIGYNRLAGYPGRNRPSYIGSPAVNVRGTVGTAAGRLGPCASFGGTNALSLGMYPSFDPARATGDWTLSFDFYATAIPSIGNSVYLLSADRSDLGVRQFAFEINTGSGPATYISVSWWKSASGGGNCLQQIYPTGLLSVNTWYSVIWRYNSGSGVFTLTCNGVSTDALAVGTAGPIYNPAPTNTNAIVLGGKWDTSGGWTKTYTGRIESLRFYTRRLSDTEVATIEGGNDPTNPTTATQIILSEPQPFQVLQKNGSDQATLRVSGCLRGAAQSLTDIEYSWNGGAWTAMTATVDSTLRTFTGTATISPTAATPAGRQGTLSVRLANNTAITANVSYLGIGYVWAVGGQSNCTGAYTNPQPYSATNGLKGSFQRADGKILELDETLYNGTGWGYDNWAWGTTESASVGSIWPRVAALWADRTGYPVMIVNSGIAGASIDATSSGLQGWGPGATVGRSRLLGGYQSLRDRVLSIPGGVAALLFMEGETDAAAAMPAATYQGFLQTLADQVATDLSSIKTISSLLPSGLSGATAINTGIADATTADANCKTGPDLTGVPYDASPHWTTDANAITIAAAWDARLAVLGY